MNTLIILTALTLPSVQYGWEYSPRGEVTYIVQFDELAAEALVNNVVLSSEVPASLGEIRRIEIRYGAGTPPQATPPATYPPAVSITPPPFTTPIVSPPEEVPPKKLPVDDKAIDLASHQQSSPTEAASPPESGAADPKVPAVDDKKSATIGGWSWIMTVLALFVSLAGNAFLGWVALDYYGKYRKQMADRLPARGVED